MEAIYAAACSIARGRYPNFAASSAAARSSPAVAARLHLFRKNCSDSCGDRVPRARGVCWSGGSLVRRAL